MRLQQAAAVVALRKSYAHTKMASLDPIGVCPVCVSAYSCVLPVRISSMWGAEYANFLYLPSKDKVSLKFLLTEKSIATSCVGNLLLRG